ncbi:UDP-4-amino-4,6-dideoxy-N-acetyl-beta-L-altrosamine transaminase [Achromobacter insuavis]|uniref:UDP-4-amino-4, 6-dideoxy-N-acetyl-beta-L-altrosamine transaminase n=1 Tax=Achromobacter insuavis TaxID=1287735 RepID=UPI0029DDD765|nr:UDP-4-amino-4,6-dideoxy-N-acetyl-beta-L-altrosamine transaminase [Achromobacter sp.]MCG2601672.1 UDP-4-amino-4,6-dideoxy-N-acetyl-beta-L-altrosamine transaminase [Achromobacter sp.]
MIPYGKQSISDDDIAEVERILRSDWLTQGPDIDAFEKSLAAYCGASQAVAVCNATAALHIACLAVGLGPGDWLWTVPNTFVASANCGRYCGASVDFVDIDPHTYNMSVDALRSKLEQAAAEGRLPKVVIPVHFAGQSCDMVQIAALAGQYGFRVIEDASHAVGADYAGQKVGCGAHSDMTVFSFHPVKIMTTAEGGAVLTNDPLLAARLRGLRSHGITRDPALMSGEIEGPWYYEQHGLGFNYRITDIQAALGSSQLRRLDIFLERRRALARRYDALLADLPVVTPLQAGYGRSSFHLYPIQLTDAAGAPRRAVFEGMRERGVGVNVHYIPVHLQPYYRDLGFTSGMFPVAENYYRRAISLPLYYGLTDAEQDQVVQALRDSLP